VTAGAMVTTTPDEGLSRPAEVSHAALRGAIAATAMSGMRAFTVDIDLVE